MTTPHIPDDLLFAFRAAALIEHRLLGVERTAIKFRAMADAGTLSRTTLWNRLAMRLSQLRLFNPALDGQHYQVATLYILRTFGGVE